MGFLDPPADLSTVWWIHPANSRPILSQSIHVPIVVRSTTFCVLSRSAYILRWPVPPTSPFKHVPRRSPILLRTREQCLLSLLIHLSSSKVWSQKYIPINAPSNATKMAANINACPSSTQCIVKTLWKNCITGSGGPIIRPSPTHGQDSTPDTG